MNIFITGATGFIGSNLVKHLLKNGHNVHVGLRKESDFKNIRNIKNEIDIYYFDDSVEALSTFFELKKIEVVFHLASCFIAEHNERDISRLVNSNIYFGTYILDAMRLSGVDKIVNTGTSWQHYENGDYNPVCLYAATKEAFENILKYYHEAESISCITLKLFDSYGETDNRPKLINLLNTFSKEKKVLDMSEGNQEINLLHVDDICRGFERAFEILNGKTNQRKIFASYALAARETLTLKGLIMSFKEITGREISINWGERPYRKREVMKLWSNYELLPGWQQEIPLEKGLRKLFGP